MEKYSRILFKRIIQILIVATISFLMDYLSVVLSNDESIWLGESIEAVGSIICGPIVGGIATLIGGIMTDLFAYHSLEYSFTLIFEATSMALIGVIYRSLIKDEDKFGVREIVVFNFIQILVNVSVLYLSTPPAAIIFFGFIVEDWTNAELLEEMGALGDNTFSACISIALIGTVLLAVCIAIRKKMKEEKCNIIDAIKSILKPNFLSKEYRGRAVEYSIGIAFSIALTMIDGVVSGHFLGEKALAATSLMFPLISFGTFFSMIIASGCAFLSAAARGDGDYERANKLFTLGFLTTIVISLLQSVLFYSMEEFYFKFYATSKEIEILAREYYRIYILVPPFMTLTKFLDEMVASDGDDALSHAGYLMSFVVNVVVSVILSRIIGMAGLAIGTLLSYVSYLLLVSAHFLRKSNTYRYSFWFSFRDIFRMARESLKDNTSGLCMFMLSVAFTKAILLFWGDDYLIANTVLCAMVEVYEIINGPSEAADFLIATYTGEKNGEGVKQLFKESLSACLISGMVVSIVILLLPSTILILYGIEDSALSAELIKSIRFCAVGVIAASAGGFLSDYYGNLGKPFWSVMMVGFRMALFPILFCVTFSLQGGVVAMGRGLLLSQIFAICIFYCFVFIIKGSKDIPYMLDDPDFEKVKMNSFEYIDGEYERISSWIAEKLISQGIEDKKIKEVNSIVFSLYNKTKEKNPKGKVFGECVLRFLDDPQVIIKDNGKLFKPDVDDERVSYNVLMSCNSSMIRIG